VAPHSFFDALPVADAFKRAANELGVPIVWGGDWPKFRDGPHIELNRAKYP
jgi:peptidoglycan L-alanyl-D-glutamate endopeptidase CwlK